VGDIALVIAGAALVGKTLTRLARRWFLVVLLVFVTPARGEDPHAPQLDVSFLAQPAPIVQYGSRRLVYEMLVTNFSQNSYVLDAIETRSGEMQFEFIGSQLAAMIKHLGVAPPKASPADRTIEAGRSLLIFFMLDLGRNKAPATIEHSLHVLDDKGGAHDVEPAPLPVSDESPIVVAPPLRGEWIAGDSANNGPDAAHRRAVIILGGHPWLAQRYAIDWVQARTIDGVRTTWKGLESDNDSYFCYDQPIYSVAAGKVVDMADSLPENVPHSGTFAYPIDFGNAAGNHVVVEIAPGRYVLYAHMRPGTLRVKVGQEVGTEEVIGHVGNTGSSNEPHLHMHIDNQPSFLAGDGVPYEFTSFDASGPVEIIVAPNSQTTTFGSIGPQKPFTNDYPAANALVTFK
jgi:hypothetical protein